MTIRYAAAIAAILCATAFPAFAGPFYQLVGGICNDGSDDGNGQLLCSDNIAATVEMADGYVPGTPFADSTQGLRVTVAFFTFSDGFVTIATDFPLGASGPGNFGSCPTHQVRELCTSTGFRASSSTLKTAFGILGKSSGRAVAVDRDIFLQAPMETGCK